MIVQLTTPMLELWRIDGDFSNQPHAHDSEYQITVPVQGDCHFTLESTEYRLSCGDALVQHPGERHYFESSGKSGMIVVKIRQESWLGSKLGPSSEWDAKQRFDPTQLSRNFRMWMDTLMKSDPCDRLIQEQTESQVIEYLTARMTGDKRPTHPPFEPSVSVKDLYLQQVLDYIHNHYREGISVDTLAGIAAQSRYHFIRFFKSATGQTPYQYVLKLRMQEAMRLLRTTRTSVTDIALSVGYSSASPFYRAFVNTYGVSPDVCRAT